jgi:protein-disulfide isomerase
MKHHIIFSTVALAIALGLGAVIPFSKPSLAQAVGDNVLSRESVLRDPEIPSLGNPEGDVTIVEYFDYRCPHCKKADPELMRVAQEDGKVRIVFKDWPIFGGASIYAAKMALSSKYQNKYVEAHKALIGAKSGLTEASARDLLDKAGIDVARATADLQTNEKTIDALLARNNSQAEAFGFQGTPAYIIGTFRVPGVLDVASFKHAISDARKAAKSDSQYLTVPLSMLGRAADVIE